MEALREHQRYTYADYCTRGDEDVAVHVIEGCFIDIGDVFGD